MEVSCYVELDGGNHTGNELQEYQKGEVRLDLMSTLPHGLGHAEQDVGVLARMDCWHGQVIDERERLHGECLIQVLLLDVLLDQLVLDRLPLNISGREEHPGGVVVFVIDDVHFIVPGVLFLLLLLLDQGRMEHYYFLSLLSLYLFLLSTWKNSNSSPAEGFFQNQILLLLIQVLGMVLWVGGWSPSPG